MMSCRVCRFDRCCLWCDSRRDWCPHRLGARLNVLVDGMSERVGGMLSPVLNRYARLAGSLIPMLWNAAGLRCDHSTRRQSVRLNELVDGMSERAGGML